MAYFAVGKTSILTRKLESHVTGRIVISGGSSKLNLSLKAHSGIRYGKREQAHPFCICGLQISRFLGFVRAA